MADVLLAGDLAVRDPGDDALVDAFRRGLPERDIALLRALPTGRATESDPRVITVAERRRVLRALHACQVLVLGDGSLRGAGGHLRQALRISLLAKARGRRVALLGVGAGELHRRQDRFRAALLVRLADLLVVRDPSSAAVLAAAGAPGPFRVAADPAWSACADDEPDRGRREGVLVVLDSRTVSTDALATRRLAAALDVMAAQGVRARLAPWRVSRHGGDDLDLARTIASHMGARPRILLPPRGLPEARAETAGARVVLVMRLHAAILAASIGTPFVSLTTDHELTSLGQRLAQTVLPPTVAPEALAHAVLAAALGPPAQPAAVRAERTAAQEGFRLLRLLLDADQSDEDHDLAALPLMPDTVPALAAEASR